MARACEICGKTTTIGNRRKLLRGHYNITAKRTFKPNLQKITHKNRRLLACAKCIRTLTRQTV